MLRKKIGTTFPSLRRLYKNIRSKNSARQCLANKKEWLLIDRENGSVHLFEDGTITQYASTDLTAFNAVAEDYLRMGWINQHYGTFTWLGVPLFQYPEDMIRWQELIWRIKPDIVIETGIYKGGSLLLSASICRILGKGRVIGIDVTVPDEVRTTIAQHPLGDMITMYEGFSTDREIFSSIEKSIRPDDVVLIILDSDHSKANVLAELELYGPLVSQNSFIIVCDGIMRLVAGKVEDAPREWLADNPYEAAKEFAENHDEFEWKEPYWSAYYTEHKNIVSRYFENGTGIGPEDGYKTVSHTHWPGAYLRKK